MGILLLGRRRAAPTANPHLSHSSPDPDETMIDGDRRENPDAYSDRLEGSPSASAVAWSMTTRLHHESSGLGSGHTTASSVGDDAVSRT
ncbi:hypothetical protein [Rhodococcus sp. NPDC057529]|uniref:hypothetical protein n=1 Tax=Rhodococcus sp. NPDC057529 TaxID=3346158 RepID=UPI00366FA655